MTDSPTTDERGSWVELCFGSAKLPSYYTVVQTEIAGCQAAISTLLGFVRGEQDIYLELVVF